MSDQPTLKVWTNHDLDAERLDWLREHIAPHHLIVSNQDRVNNLTAGGRDEECVYADIAFGQPSVEDLMASTDLQWVHITSAGYTRYDRSDLREALLANGIAFTNSSSVYDDPCAQHALAMMLGHNRRIIASAESHREGKWTYDALRPIERVLGGETVLIVGYGAIGVRLTELLSPFGCEIRGVRRQVSGDEPVPTFAIAELDEHFGWADHVVNLLPASESTTRLFDTQRFGLMKPGAAFYNVGRGDTVDQDALVSGLESGHVGAAYLDVTSPEPLPEDHPLWRAPNCLITPHVAGGMQNEQDVLLRHFARNFSRFLDGEPLTDLVRSLNS
ncbi:MAG: D-2-hydroxyacid dehydrogenase [Armatimonadetes bacterium]|nr:D-2-hydroxyacid dehydrogenase [Armatimonadota bacterium]